MSADAVVLTERREHIAVLTFNRVDRLNALNAAVREAVVRALGEWAQDPAVRVVVMTGAGQKAFVAGADITEFVQRTPLEQFTVADVSPVFDAVAQFPKPTIAAVNGYCLGGGCEVALACDIRIAAETARFGQPEVNLGILPGGGGTQRLARLVGTGAAYRMLYTGETISAAEALRIGLVEDVVPAEQLLDRALALAATVARKSPVALRLIKQAVRASTRMALDDGLRYEAALLGVAFSSADKEEGVRAFLEKRDANFKGR